MCGDVVSFRWKYDSGVGCCNCCLRQNCSSGLRSRTLCPKYNSGPCLCRRCDDDIPSLILLFLSFLAIKRMYIAKEQLTNYRKPYDSTDIRPQEIPSVFRFFGLEYYSTTVVVTPSWN